MAGSARLVALLAGLCGCAPKGPPPGSSEAAAGVVAQALASPDASVRAVALDAVGAAGLEDHLPAIRQAADDADPFVRAAALRARLALEPAAAAEALRALAASPESRMQRRALATLDARLPPELGADVVEQAARSSEPAIRSQALSHLRLLPPEARRRVVTAALADPDDAVRFVAIRAAYENRLADPLGRLLEELIMGAPERRAQAARLLGEVGEAAAAPALLHAAGTDEGVVGPTAQASLCRLGVEAECGRLKAAVASRHAHIAGPAIAALVAAGTPEARQMLAVAVGHPEPEVRREAALAIGASHHADTLRLLVPLLSDERGEPRALAAAALVEVEPEKALAAVREAALGSNPGLRSKMVEVLARRYGERADERAAEALTLLARLTPPLSVEPLRDAELETVGQALLALLRHGPESTRAAAADAALRHPAPELRYLAARGVARGDLGDPGAALEDAVSDPVPSVRVAAAVARLRLARSGMIVP